MKLYTEEQVREAMKEARYSFSTDKGYDKILESITPIEIPSYEDIKQKIESLKGWILIEKEFYEVGAKWMREQIQKQRQKQLLSEIMQADEKD